MTDDPQSFREDPELERLDAIVGQQVDVRPLRLDPESLPVAPWEGAKHRAWPLAVLAALATAALAGILFALGGMSVSDAIAALTASLREGSVLRLATAFGGAVWDAPVSFHVLILVAFLAVNFIFYRLLRRAPRGIDASTR